jgi:hypothetical protein
MMDQQMDTMSEQPQDPQEQQDQVDQQESVSADQRCDTAPDVTQTPQEAPPEDTPPMNRLEDRPGTSEDQQGQQDQEAAPTQPPQQNQPNQPNAVDMADMSTPPAGERPSPDGPPVAAGNLRTGPDRAPTATAGRQEPGDALPIPLLSAEVAGPFLERWDALQATFVDEPHRVVEQADSLVAEVMQRIAENMAQERTSLERQWEAGDAVSTEDLRLALQHYRSFFKRLLSA